MKIFIGADHQGAQTGKELEKMLNEEGYEAEYTKLENNPEDDYPDFAFDVCSHVLKENNSIGVLICGNGIGISIAANKVKGIRCARVVNEIDAYHAKNHNGANVIAFGGLDSKNAFNIIKKFIETPSPTEERHLRRIAKIIEIEKGS